MLGVCRALVCILTLSILIAFVDASSAQAEEQSSSHAANNLHTGIVGLPSHGSDSVSKLPPVLPLGTVFERQNDYQIKVAYGRTFGTSTTLDYATLELSKPLTRYSASKLGGLASAEFQFAVLGSYVVYYQGDVERIKRLDFRDGYELAWLPKSKFILPTLVLGLIPYLENGAGVSYVSETYRNSGSRFNWSLLGGMGVEKPLSEGLLSMGLQWRHLSNGNMWGKGDELHNSNSGTDMVQLLASLVQQF